MVTVERAEGRGRGIGHGVSGGDCELYPGTGWLAAVADCGGQGQPAPAQGGEGAHVGRREFPRVTSEMDRLGVSTRTALPVAWRRMTWEWGTLQKTLLTLSFGD